MLSDSQVFIESDRSPLEEKKDESSSLEMSKELSKENKKMAYTLEQPV